MDPKTLNTLDPKLRETYERVMGAASPTTPATNTPPLYPAAPMNTAPAMEPAAPIPNMPAQVPPPVDQPAILSSTLNAQESTPPAAASSDTFDSGFKPAETAPPIPMQATDILNAASPPYT